MAKQLRKYSGRGRMILIGPVRIWAEPKSGRDMYGIVAATIKAIKQKWPPP